MIARCDANSSPEFVRDAIAAAIPAADVLTTKEFISKTIRYWMLETGLGLTFITTAILGIIVGTVIISQALYAITNDHLPNYATLLAIGFGRWQLGGIVLIQATILGIIGMAGGSAVFGRIARVSQSTPVSIETTPMVFGGIAIVFLVSCLAASFLSVRSIFRIDPISVFRN